MFGLARGARGPAWLTPPLRWHGPAGARRNERPPPRAARCRAVTVLAASAVVWVLIPIPLVIVGALGVVDLVRRDLSPWRAAPNAR